MQKAVTKATGPGEGGAAGGRKVAADAAARRTIIELARGASIETATKNLAEIDGYPSLIPAGTEVYIPSIPGHPYHHAVDVARRLREVGMEPVPHIAARRLVSAAQLGDFLSRLASEASVRTVLLIAGDAEQPAGPFASSAEALETEAFEAAGVRRIGIAGYPEPHPKISRDELDRALARKVRYARAAGIELFLVTQFCLEADPISAWVRRLREGGFELPVQIGLAGVSSIRTLARYSVRCGIGNSLRALSRAPMSLTRMVTQYGPDEVLPGLAAGLNEITGANVSGLHMFSFGGFASTAEWLCSVAAGGPVRS